MTASDPAGHTGEPERVDGPLPFQHSQSSFLERVVHSLTLPLILTNDQLQCLYFNRAAEQLTGYTNEEVNGRHLTAILHLSQPPELYHTSDPDPISMALQQEQPVRRAVILRCKDGTRVSVTLVASGVWESDRVRGVSIELHDPSNKPITDTLLSEPHYQSRGLQRQTEHEYVTAALEIQHSQLVTVFEQSPAAIATLQGPDHIFKMANARYYQIIGHRDIVGKPVREALPELAEQGFVALLDQVYHTGEPFVAHQVSAFVQHHPDGPREECIVDFIYQPLFETNGSVYGILTLVVDVTQWVQAQQHHATIERRYQYLVATLPQSVYLVDMQGVLLEVNAAGERLLGRTADEMVGRHFRDFIAPEDLTSVFDAFSRLLMGVTDTIELEFHILRPSGERRLAQVAVATMVAQGEIVGIHGTARDITDERARDERMHLLSMVLEELEQGVALMDKDYVFRFANPAARTILGIPAESEDLFHINQFIPDAAAQREFAAITSTLHETGHWTGRTRRRRLSDGEILLLDVMKGMVLGVDGQPLYFTVFQDASEAIQREQHLRRAERLASLGTLISGVAHELNNPLTTIISSCELLLMEPRSEQDHDDIQTIGHEAQRMARIVSDLRVSARYTQEQNQLKGPVDLNAVVQHVLKLRAYRLRTGNISVETTLADDLPPVYGDTAQLEQVLLNLVINAEHAMQPSEKQHRLIVRTSRTKTDVMLEVGDTGVGIDPTHRERLFDPFFTTKAPGEGIGLGLSLAHSIVQEHGGAIQVDSQVGSGTTFRVQLRVARDRVPDTPHTDEPASPAPQRILLIDDEVAICQALARFLRRRGHQVDIASDGTQALRLLKKHSYECIISDLRMPGMSGEHLLGQLQERGVTSRLLLFTGDATSEALARIQARGGVEVLFKPISPSEVAQAIESHWTDKHSQG